MIKSIKPQINRCIDSAKMRFRSKFGNYNFNRWWLILWTNSKWINLDVLSSIWPFRSRSIKPQNNRDFCEGDLHFWSKFGNYRLNHLLRRKAQGSHTDAGNDTGNIRRPNLVSCKNLSELGISNIATTSWFQHQSDKTPHLWKRPKKD